MSKLELTTYYLDEKKLKRLREKVKKIKKGKIRQ